MAQVHITAGTLAVLACCVALPAAAQNTSIATLEARVAELENQPKLGFGAPGIDVTFYGYVKADLIYDFDSAEVSFF